MLTCMTGQYFAISGAGGGIGRATAIRCAELGAAGLSLADIDVEATKETEKILNDRFPDCKILTATANISKLVDVSLWIESAAKEFGHLNGCANVAGISRRTPDTNSGNIRDEDWNETVAVNLTGTMQCMRLQIKYLVRPGGSIVNISSGAGMKGVAGMPSYSATKWGVRGLTKCAAIEFGPVGIRVNCLMPGPIHSGPNFDRAIAMGLADPVKFSAGTCLKRMGTTDEVGKVVAFLMSDDASYITGADIPVDGGATTT